MSYNISNFTITQGARGQATITPLTFSFQLYDDSGALIADYSGRDALTFPGFLDVFSQSELQEIIRYCLMLALPKLEIAAGKGKPRPDSASGNKA